MDLAQNLRIVLEHIDNKDHDTPTRVCVKDGEGRIIFGRTTNFSDEYEKLRGKVINYLNSNYPDWEDPTKYWNWFGSAKK